MTQFKLQGRAGSVLTFTGVCIADVEALNHDDTVRCVMRLYQSNTDYVCYRIERPDTLDARFSFERCADALSVYQFFGTEPLANFLYGVVRLDVPGLCNKLRGNRQTMNQFG